MNSKPVRFALIGTGQRATAYAANAADVTGLELTLLSDVDAQRLDAFADDLALTDARRCTDPLAACADPDVDAVIVCTPDHLHVEPAVTALKAGKHVLLEKPMATTAEDCRLILDAHANSGKVLQLGFVLRSTRFYQTIKRIVDAGTLGQLMSIEATECLGLSHAAAFMRRWHRRREHSGGLILTKCSHDMDILNWLAGGPPRRVSSFGGLNFFTPDKQPATHCSICPEKNTCWFAFDGGFIFMTPQDKADPSRHDRDLCVYTPDKDIVDNQLCLLEYPGGLRASFSLQLFQPHGLASRTMVIRGTRATLFADNARNRVDVHHLDDRGHVEHFDTAPLNRSGHGGGDRTLLESFADNIQRGVVPSGDGRDGLLSTMVCAAIEQARHHGRVVELPEV